MARLAKLFANRTTTESHCYSYGTQTVVTVSTWYGRTVSVDVVSDIRDARRAAARFGR